MEIELAWSSVLKLFGMGVLTYLLSPVLLAVRDSIVWWSIKKFFYNKKTREIMARYCHDRAWVDFSGIIPFRILGSGENTKYYLNDREVTVDVFLHQKKVWEELSVKTTEQGIYLKAVEKRIDRLLKHYKMDEGNPLRENKERLYEGFGKTFTKK